MENGMDLIGSLVADSSEQRSYNYMLSRFEFVAFEPEWTVQQRLAHNWSKSFVSTTLSPALLGYGEATFTRKLLAMWHVFQMKTGTDIQFDRFRNCIIGCCTDQASTERKLADAPALHRQAEVSSVLDSCEQGETQLEAADSTLYLFPRGLGATDPLHTIWNTFEAAIKGVGTVDEDIWKTYVEQLRGILAFLGHRGRRQRWLSSRQLPENQAHAFAAWRFRLVDWKWQYMSDMWGSLSSSGEFFLANVDIAELKKPIDSNDDREEALDNASMAAIAAAAADKDFFMTLTEAYFVFSQSVNRGHAWLTGCPCHDHIWMSDESAEAKQLQFEAETGCKGCWRRGRRGSELARGYARKICTDVMGANSKRLQRRLRLLDPDRRSGLLHSLERMKRTWAEEIADKLHYWECLPTLLLGVWPNDDQSQAIAERCVSEWNACVEKGTADTCNRVTKMFMDDSNSDNVLAKQIRILDETGIFNDELQLACQEYNLLSTHSQRGEELHAQVKRATLHLGRQALPSKVSAVINLPSNLELMQCWEARSFVVSIWFVRQPDTLLSYSNVSHAVRIHAPRTQKELAVYHAHSTQLFGSASQWHTLIQRWQSCKVVTPTTLPPQEKMLMDLFIERLQGKVISSTMILFGAAEAQPDPVPHEYNKNEIVAMAMDCARAPMDVKQMSLAFRHHHFFKVVKARLTARFNMIKGRPKDSGLEQQIYIYIYIYIYMDVDKEFQLGTVGMDVDKEFPSK